MRVRSACAAVAVVAAVAFSGCGDEGSVLEANAVPAAATPAFLVQSATLTAAVETGTVDVEITADGGTARLTGQFDTTRPAGAATLTAQGFDTELGDVTAELVYDGDVVYVKPDGYAGLFGESLGTPWLKLDLDGHGELGGFLPGDVELPTVDPATLVERLRADGIEVTEVGAEDVRGVATTHYTATVPAGAGSLGGPAAVADVWIDADGLVRRIELAASGEYPFTLEAELYDLGAPVTITAPPADQVTDLGDLGELFGQRPR